MNPTTVLSSACEEAARKIRELVYELNLVAEQRVSNAPSTRPTLSPSSSALIAFGVPEPISQSELRNKLLDISSSVSSSLDELIEAMNDHFVLFYSHMRRRVEEEHAFLRQTRSLMPSDPRVLRHFVEASSPAALALMQTIGEVNPSQVPMLAAGLTSATNPNPSSTTTSPTNNNNSASRIQQQSQALSEKDLATDAIHISLHLQLQSAVHLTESTRGAIYLRRDEGAGYIHCVSQINGEGRLPSDVGLACGSTLGTVVQYVVGVSFAKTAPATSTLNSPRLSSTTLRVDNALIVPISVPGGNCIGCIVVADKGPHTRKGFDTYDELCVWSTSISITAMLQRYPHATFLQPILSPRVASTFQALERHAQIPKIRPCAPRPPNKAPESLEPTNVCDLVPRRHLPIQMMRFGSELDVDLFPKEALGSQELVSNEQIFESAAPYMHSLEELWRKAIENTTSLRSDCERYEEEIQQRNARIIELEVNLKKQEKHVHRMKMDLVRLKGAVPHLLTERYQPIEKSDETGKELPHSARLATTADKSSAAPNLNVPQTVSEQPNKHPTAPVLPKLPTSRTQHHHRLPPK